MLNRLIIALSAVSFVFVLAALFVYQSMLPGTVRLRFEAVVGNQALVFNESAYQNPGGEGLFLVRSFQFYLSNIQFIGTNGTYTVPGSYHLARFDNPSSSYEVVIDNVPHDQYSRVILSIGVDPVANASDSPVGDLDPRGRMAWNGDTGYKFVLFEGALLDDDEIRPLVYHVGFSENYKILEFGLPGLVVPGSSDAVPWSVDVMALFSGADTIDMAAMTTVESDRDDARLLANNYATMISLGR